MGTIERFEDLIAWQKARSMTSAIYGATGVGRFAQDYGLRNQIQRASVSVMSNIAEGFERNKPTEFHQFLCIAKGFVRRSAVTALCRPRRRTSRRRALSNFARTIRRGQPHHRGIASRSPAQHLRLFTQHSALSTLSLGLRTG